MIKKEAGGREGGWQKESQKAQLSIPRGIQLKEREAS